MVQSSSGGRPPGGRSDTTPDPEVIERLRQAVEGVVRPGQQSLTGALVDRELEKRLAPLVAKATRLVNHRDRSEAELRRRLTETLEEGADPRLVDTVIERCLNNGMIDDTRFAGEWVRQRQHNQRRSTAVLRRELRDKGVSPAVIEDALAQICDADQQEILRSLVTKKAGTVKAVPADRTEYDRALRRIVGVAARRGFPAGQSLTAARDALDTRITELGG